MHINTHIATQITKDYYSQYYTHTPEPIENPRQGFTTTPPYLLRKNQKTQIWEDT